MELLGREGSGSWKDSASKVVFQDVWGGIWLLRNREEVIPDGVTEARAWGEEGQCWRLF